MGVGRSGWGSEASLRGGAGDGLLNMLISFLSMLISLPRNGQGNTPWQHLDNPKQRTDAKDAHQHIQLVSVELDAAAHMQRQITPASPPNCGHT
jgi:hypothetical protein